MATSTSTLSSEMSHTPFSYAQAAKGQAAAQSAPQRSTSPAPPSVSSQGKDDATTASTAATVLSSTSGDNDTLEPTKQAKMEDESAQKQDSDVSPGESAVVSRSVSETTSNTVGNGDSAPAETRQSVSEEKSRRRSPSRTSRSNENDARKGRKGKKGRKDDKEGEADKAQADKEEKEPPKPIILSEAPIPSVNIWQKRKEAQAAKTKVVPAASSQSAASAQTSPIEDSKKRTTTEEVDTPAAAQNGTNGEKAQQRKSVDFSRIADQVPRRSGPRGSRTQEKDEKTGAESLPPVADSALWPDVKAAVAAEEKKKPQDKTERSEKEAQDEAGPSKRKKEWKAIPYVPTVNFQTPMPQRTSKPRGGARGGREAGTTRGAHSGAGNASVVPAAEATSDKAQTVTNGAPVKEGRPREGSGATRANSLPPTSKRASIDASFNRDARKPSAPVSSDIRREQASENHSQSGAAKTENGRVGRPDFAPTGSEQPSQSGTRSFSDVRRESGFKGFESYKEAGIPAPKEQGFAARDRPEGQGRGRGGYRGRGGHSASVAGHQHPGYSVNGQYPVHQLPGRQTGPYSPPAHQNAFGTAYGAAPARGGGRGNQRGNAASSSWVKANGAGGPARMAPVNGPYDYQMGQYTAYPPMQAPVVFDTAVIPVLTAQIEYYLSLENLCKDMFLRKHMDSQGFVPFDLIAGFHRVKAIAPDAEHIRMACEVSDKLDYVVGAEDSRERLRLRDGWDKFVFPMEKRDEEARNEGPANFYFRSRHSRPAYTAPMLPMGYPATSPTLYPGNFPTEEQMYQQPYMNGAHFDAGVNGGEMNGQHYGAETQLSAAVPEFSPGLQQVPFTLEGATTFSDEQVAGLMVLVADTPSGSAGHAASPVANGTGIASPDAASNSAEIQSPSGVTRNIIWAAGQKPANMDGKGSEQPYAELLSKALDERRSVKAGETSRGMKNLYEFWSHFLVYDFNAKMYDEFRNCALEDAGKEVPARFGLKCLLQYYDELLHGDKKKPWGNDQSVPEVIKLHYHSALMMDPTYRPNGETQI